MGGESRGELNRLRSQARRMGIRIRTQPADGPSNSRAYSLIDRETGTVIYADVQGLADLQTRLWRIVRDRRFASANQLPANGATNELCPSCGSPRIGLFRWCRSCGLDYEANAHPQSDRAQDYRPHSAEPVVLPPPPHLTQLLPPRERFAALRILVGKAYPFRSIRELGIGAILGLLVGVIVSIVLGGTR